MEQIFKTGAVSAATRAKKILTAQGIKSRITKTDGGIDCCAWGIAVSGDTAPAAARVLRAEGIRYEAL